MRELHIASQDDSVQLGAIWRDSVRFGAISCNWAQLGTIRCNLAILQFDTIHCNLMISRFDAIEWLVGPRAVREIFPFFRLSRSSNLKTLLWRCCELSTLQCNNSLRFARRLNVPRETLLFYLIFPKPRKKTFVKKFELLRNVNGEFFSIFVPIHFDKHRLFFNPWRYQ